MQYKYTFTDKTGCYADLKSEWDVNLTIRVTMWDELTSILSQSKLPPATSWDVIKKGAKRPYILKVKRVGDDIADQGSATLTIT